MAKTSFTVHLDVETAKKIELMKEENPEFSRNALIRLAVQQFRLNKLANDHDDDIYNMDLLELKHLVLHGQVQINAIHKQLNPDWKRKKSLPYHFPHEYRDVKNYSDS